MTDNNLKNTSGRNFKQGMYHTIVSVFVIAMVIIVNMFVSKLDIKLDFTRQELYTLTDATKKYAKTLKDDITIYFLAKENSKYEVLENVINQYEKLPHISVEWKDPDLYPMFAQKYTDSEITGNDVIVVNNKNEKSKFIPFQSMYIEDYSMNYTTYNYDYSTSLDAEGQITSAIQYVTSDNISKIYYVSAHNETPIGTEVQELIAKGTYEFVELDIASVSEIPDDCEVLIINGPEVDITDEEFEMYKQYLDNGGNAILSLLCTPDDLKNYYNLIDYYGVTVNKYLVCDQEQNYAQNPFYILCNYEDVTKESIASDFELKDVVIAPGSMPLTIKDSSDNRSTLEVRSIVKSSENSYAKTSMESNDITKSKEDIDGPFDIVIQAMDTYKDKSSKVVICANPSLLCEDEFIDYLNFTNIDLFKDTIDWMSEKEQKTVSIPVKSLDDVRLNVDPKDATIWGVITIFILPVSILAFGIVLWILRRRR